MSFNGPGCPEGECSRSVAGLKGRRQRKKFRCCFCPYASAYYSNMFVHLKVHTKEKPYFCGVCGQRSTQGSTLKLHIRSNHPDDPNAFNKTKGNKVKLVERPDSDQLFVAPVIDGIPVMDIDKLQKLLEIPRAPEETSPEPPQPAGTRENIPAFSPQNHQWVPQMQQNLYALHQFFFFYQQIVSYYQNTSPERGNLQYSLQLRGLSLLEHLFAIISLVDDPAVRESLILVAQQISDLFK